MQSVIAIYVENKYGVLARVTGLFMRKCFNINSLTVGETEDPKYSRITVTLNGDEFVCDQLIAQLRKLQNVKTVKLLNKENSVEREIMLVKVKSTPENRSEIVAAADIYRAKIVDYNTRYICVEVTGEPSKINAFIEVVKPLGIIEICRTGIVALERKENIME